MLLALDYEYTQFGYANGALVQAANYMVSDTEGFAHMTESDSVEVVQEASGSAAQAAVQENAGKSTHNADKRDGDDRDGPQPSFFHQHSIPPAASLVSAASNLHTPFPRRSPNPFRPSYPPASAYAFQPTFPTSPATTLHPSGPSMPVYPTHPNPATNTGSTNFPRHAAAFRSISSAASTNISQPSSSLHLSTSDKGAHKKSSCPSPGAIRMRAELGMPATAQQSARGWNAVYSVAPPPNVDLRLTGNVVVTSVELLMFFTAHDWDDYIRRLHNAGWSFMKAFKLAYSIRRVGDNPDNQRSVLWKRFTSPKFITGNGHAYTDYTCSGWAPPDSFTKSGTLMDYYLEDVANGVPRENFPTGLDKGPLTWAVEHVLDNQDHTLKLSGMSQFVQKMGLDQHFAVLGMGANASVNADVATCNRLGGQK
ncbi:hypothetical protein CC80DRAFT_550461 [Byssothecium circinans]|uniref:Uncharacterized protein n=1 Tax=Byssothecium circinans TaxID=147558 RepID=A0A6A5TUT1_9PLEO|nr:hypothetical protein CC80DRAFT_550461 [Byssothecium circinans]